MNSRFLVRIFMIFIAMTAYFTVALANSEDENKEDFLNNYGSTVVLLNSINSSHASSLLGCACYLQSQNQSTLNPSCPADSRDKPEFIKSGVNFYGQVFTKQFTCQKIIEFMVYKRIESDYNSMRLSMGLMRSEVQYKTSPELSETFGNLDYEQDSKYKITVTPEHDIKKMPWDKVPLKTPASFNDVEIESLLNLYKEFGYKKCESALEESREKIVANLHPKFQAQYQSMDNHSICFGLIESNEKSRLKTHFLSILYKMREARDSEFRQEYKENYAKLMQSNPLLGLVSNSKPELNEVIDALAYISSNAKKRLAESQEQLDKKDYLQFMQFSFADSYAKVIWSSKGLSDQIYSDNFDYYSKKFESKEFKKNILIGGSLVGVAVACALPWGKGLSVALQFAKLSCLSSLGIPVNTYFFIDSLLMYNTALSSIFSHIETAYKLEKSLDRLDDARVNIGLSALFLPVGMGLVEGKKALMIFRQNKFFR